MLTLDTELEIAVRSAGPEVENGCTELEPWEPRRCGMFMPLLAMTGEESGEDSASVE